jgi:hypothetical protein
VGQRPGGQQPSDHPDEPNDRTGKYAMRTLTVPAGPDQVIAEPQEPDGRLDVVVSAPLLLGDVLRALG